MLELGVFLIGGMLAFVALGIFSAENDSALLSTATFVGGIALLEFGFEISIMAAFAANPLLILGSILTYVVIGAIYTALWRWPEFIRKNRTEIMSDYNEWAKHVPSDQDNSFDKFLESYKYKFNAGDHKGRLGTWVGLWPFSMFWELARKPAIWAWDNAYRSLGNLFQRISHNTARKIHDKRD